MKRLSPELALLLEPFAELVAEKLAAKLLGAAAPSTVYTSSVRGPNPPGKSRAWALRTIKTMPGSRKVGRDWQVSVEAYEAWLSERDAARVEDRDVKPANDILRLTEQALAEGGFRRAR